MIVKLKQKLRKMVWMSFPVKRSQKCPRNLPIRVKGRVLSSNNLETIIFHRKQFSKYCLGGKVDYSKEDIKPEDGIELGVELKKTK